MRLLPLLTLISVAALSGCDSSTDNCTITNEPALVNEGTMVIAPAKQVCSSNNGALCYQVSDSAQPERTDWNYDFSGSDFHYRWGVQSRIQYQEWVNHVTTEGECEVMPDARPPEIEVVAIDEQIEATIGTEYRVTDLSLGQYTISQREDGVYQIHFEGEDSFTCAENVDCETLVGMDGTVDLRFRYTGADVPIELVWWN